MPKIFACLYFFHKIYTKLWKTALKLFHFFENLQSYRIFKIEYLECKFFFHYQSKFLFFVFILFCYGKRKICITSDDNAVMLNCSAKNTELATLRFQIWQLILGFEKSAHSLTDFGTESGYFYADQLSGKQQKFLRFCQKSPQEIKKLQASNGAQATTSLCAVRISLPQQKLNVIGRSPC